MIRNNNYNIDFFNITGSIFPYMRGEGGDEEIIKNDFVMGTLLTYGCHPDSLINIKEESPHCLGASIKKTTHSMTLHSILGQKKK